jgi:histidine ammonia-lyase
MPQVHGACLDAIDYAEWVVNLELNAVTDNPLIFIKESLLSSPSSPSLPSLENSENSENSVNSVNSVNSANLEIEVISGGNFHGEPLALSMDYMAIALTELGNISERRIMKLTDESSNSHVLPAFLTEHGGLNSGFMIVQYTAAALCNENKILSHPASADTIPSSANVEDHVSMGVTSVLKLRRVVENLEQILALELFCAAQGVDFRKKIIGAEKSLGKGTQKIYNLIRSRVPFIEKDEYMKRHIDVMLEIIREIQSSGQQI